MRTPERTPGVLRDVAAIGAAMAAVGASFGAMAVAAGLPGWAAVAMSMLVYAGGAQFMAIGLMSAGNPVAAVLAGLLINARHLPFGLALGDAIGHRLRHRLLGSHLMTDEATAFTLARPAGAVRRRAFWLAGVLLFLAWNGGTLLGVLVGGVAGDPAAFGVDAAFPAGLIALLLPSLRDRDTRRAALGGAVVAVLTTPLLPAGLPVLLALVGPGLLAVRRLTRRHPAPADDVDGPVAGAPAEGTRAVPAGAVPAGAGPGRAVPAGGEEERC
ncbi:AzlC family ABC transporter permease [Micromonospora sonchi]|uniref:AzlC family ABC transporter permease n=1 Tax=Micromonospora sonchi TaxID=1763543 RepID=UPI001666E25D|nr:AzlC family ABC transporter permease [Micromonospora sonchi]